MSRGPGLSAGGRGCSLLPPRSPCPHLSPLQPRVTGASEDPSPSHALWVGCFSTISSPSHEFIPLTLKLLLFSVAPA